MQGRTNGHVITADAQRGALRLVDAALGQSGHAAAIGGPGIGLQGHGLAVHGDLLWMVDVSSLRAAHAYR